MVFGEFLSMFSPQSGVGGGVGWGDYPLELEMFENLGSNSLPMSHKCLSKIFKIYT